MRFFPQSSPSRTRPPSSFGLIGWLEETRIALPLKGVECRFEVRGDLIDVEMDQIYHQSAASALDCLYSFPLPAGAAIYRCEMHVNDRVIRARVEEKQEARRIFAEKKAAGRRAALVEQERENLFTLTLGNLQPRDLIVVRLAYFQNVSRLADRVSLQLPVCPGIRYIPGHALLRSLSGRGVMDDTDQVPDASRISPPRINALHLDAAYFSVHGKIDAQLAVLDSIASPSHAVLVRPAEEMIEVEIAALDAVPDSNFVLRWFEPEAKQLKPRAWSCVSGAERHALVQVRAPLLKEAAADFEQDVYFLLDRSGSMQGAKWTKSCEALRAFVDILGKRDRVWITFFESDFHDFAEKPLPRAELRRDKSFQNVVRLGVAGGTELLPAMEHVLLQISRHSRGRRATLVLITDGQVGNEDEILAALRAHPSIPVHAFGIDTTVNDAFLEQIAKQQRGRCWLQTPDDDIAAAVTKLAAQMRRPVLTNIVVQSPWELAGDAVPDLFSGEIMAIAVRCEGEAGTVRLAGTLPGGKETAIEFAPVETTNPAIKLLWAKERIEKLLATGYDEEAIALAKASNLLCQGAAFVAWDEAEKVSIGAEAIYQPSLEPRLRTDRASEMICRSVFMSPRTFYCFSPGASVHESDSSVAEDESAPEGIDDARFLGIQERYGAEPVSDTESYEELRARLVLAKIKALLQLPLPYAGLLVQLLERWALGDITAQAARVAMLDALHQELSQGNLPAKNKILRCFLEKELQIFGELQSDALYLLEEAVTHPPPIPGA